MQFALGYLDTGVWYPYTAKNTTIDIAKKHIFLNMYELGVFGVKTLPPPPQDGSHDILLTIRGDDGEERTSYFRRHDIIYISCMIKNGSLDILKTTGELAI